MQRDKMIRKLLPQCLHVTYREYAVSTEIVPLAIVLFIALRFLVKEKLTTKIINFIIFII